MVDINKEELKKFVHDYAVAIAASITLILVLVILVLARHYSLISVKDLSKINPLITSQQNRLVASNNSSEIIKIPKDDDDQSTKDAGTSTGKTNTSQTNTTGGSSGTKPSNSPPPSAGGGGTGGGNTGTNPPDTPPPFSARIEPPIRGSVTAQCNLIGAFGICIGTYVYTYTLSTAIIADNGPGHVSYNWKVTPADGTSITSTPGPYQAGSGTTSTQISYSWIGKGCKSYDVTLTLTEPANSKKSITTSLDC